MHLAKICFSPSTVNPHSNSNRKPHAQILRTIFTLSDFFVAFAQNDFNAVEIVPTEFVQKLQHDGVTSGNAQILKILRSCSQSF